MSEEPEDPKPQLVEECKESDHCKHLQHVYEHCAERIEKEGGEQNCVLEFFDLLECIDHCVGPKLFKQLV